MTHCGPLRVATGQVSPRTDLTQAKGTLDLDKRRQLMAKIEAIMQERGPIAQPVWRSIVTGMDKRVKGFRMHPQSNFRGYELAIES